MFDLHSYLRSLSDDYLKGVYICTGLTSMEGLVDDIRNTVFPCAVVEVGDEGWFDMLTAETETRTITFYILEKKDNATAADIKSMLDRTKAKGRELLRSMRRDSFEHGDVCYGIDFSSLNYFKVGPISMSAYGYCFNLTIVEQ